MKRGCSFILVVVLVMMTTISGFAFSDVSETTNGAREINALADKNYLTGYKDGSFRPNGNITRAEFVTMINKAKGFEPGVVSVNFTDVPETAWYYTFVKGGLQAGYFTGYADNTFRPFNNITREEVCAMIAQVEKLDLTVSETSMAAITINDRVSNYATTFVKPCVAAGLMDLAATGNFRATENATRTDVAVACYRILEKTGAFNETTPGNGETTDSAINGGGTSGGGTSGGSSGGSNNQPTEITAAQEKQLQNLIRCIDDDLLKDEQLGSVQKQILEMARDGMQKFLADRSYDIKANAKKARQLYNSLSDAEQEKFQNVVSNAAFDYGISTGDLLDLKYYFF